MLKRLTHVAMAAPDLPAATAFYRDVLGANVSAPVEAPHQGVTSVFVHLANTKLELSPPLRENFPIANYLARNCSGRLHHLCFGVEGVQAAAEVLTDSHIRILGNPKPGA